MLTLSLSAFGTLFKYANSLLILTHRRKKLAQRRKNHVPSKEGGSREGKHDVRKEVFLAKYRSVPRVHQTKTRKKQCGKTIYHFRSPIH